VILGRENCERVEIPYEGGIIPGLFTQATSPDGRAPCLVFINGLDSSKELLYWTRLNQELERRGVSTLCIDQPGAGEALRAYGLTAVYNTEIWAAKVVDYLETRNDVDHQRIGIAGISLGGYYAPRAVAFEPRFALGATWGGNHDWGEIQKRRLAREGDRPVPHYWEHVQWVWGAKDMDDFMDIAANTTLDGILDRVKVPFLVTHGERDRQIPLEFAQRTYDQLVNSPRRELKLFTAREGGVEHVGADNMAFGRDFIADWVAESFGTPTA
jgi:pimeloyl-ACP methyl ester carboxylesterase